MPRAEDGPAVSRLVGDCPPLDVNSAYCNLLQCTHFVDTCVVAENIDGWGGLAGWISAYRLPAAPDQLFVWQVAVHPSARGTGLGGRMLDALIARRSTRVATLLTTITETNAASWAMFASFARRRGAEITRCPMFDRDAHFAGAHETEFLVSIPLAGNSKPPVQEDL